MKAQGAIGGAYIKDLPYSCGVTFEADPQSICEEFGLFIRANEKANVDTNLVLTPIREPCVWVMMRLLSCVGIGQTYKSGAYP